MAKRESDNSVQPKRRVPRVRDGSGRAAPAATEGRSLPLPPSALAFEETYDRSLDDPEAFWAERACEVLDWETPPAQVVERDFAGAPGGSSFATWFRGGRLNAAYNCLDRHVAAGRGGDPALLFAASDGHVETFTYDDLLVATARFANVLKSRGVTAGERVVLYLPMIPELPIAMLACARIGAVHVVVFAGFSGQALRSRIEAWGAHVVVTSEAGWQREADRGLKAEVDRSLGPDSSVSTVVVVARRDVSADREKLLPGRDIWWHEAIAEPGMEAPSTCEPVPAEDPLFVLSTSGSSGAPKGVVHAVGGYLLYAADTFRCVFAPAAGDLHFCATDIGWITGHSYLVYGPLAAGTTTLLYERMPQPSQGERLLEVMASQGVTTLYTTPAVVHAFMAATGTRSSRPLPRLRVLATMGDPLSPEAWTWCHERFGRGCSVLDTWWQTETGGIALAPRPDDADRPGAGLKPFFGIDPVILRGDGKPAEPGEPGSLCLARPWPGMMSALSCPPEDTPRYHEAYFGRFPGLYYTGDQATVDDQGGFHVAGASDDDVWVHGERLASVDVERVLLSDAAVLEAVVVGYPEPVKGEGVCCYVVLHDDAEPGDALRERLASLVGELIGPFAVPDRINFVATLPRTRSGKMMRRVLRKIAEGDVTDLGDTSMLADPSVVTDLLDETRRQMR